MADYSVAQLAAAAYHAGFRGPALVTAVAIALAENPARKLHATNHNTNGTIDRGPWQINSGNKLAGNPFNLQQSADMAHKLYADRGGAFTDWTTYTSGKYRLYTTQAYKGSLRAHTIKTDTYHGIVNPQTADAFGVAGNNVLPGLGTGGALALKNPGAIGSVLHAADAVPALVGHLLSPAFWKMVGLGVLAAFLIIVGIIVILESNKTVRAGTVRAGELAAA